MPDGERTIVNASTRYWMDLVTGKSRGLLPAFLRAGLIAASAPYSLAARMRNKLYDWGWLSTNRVGVPVIVVGNLSVGGTGKTPAVEYLARFYRGYGRRVAILSRGYGVSNGRNDEALVLEANLDDVPHLQGADRVALARVAVEELESDLLVLDDGFQHRRLHRDLNFVLVDATQPGRWCLPGGLLREPRSGLQRADAVVITRSDQCSADTLERLHASIANYLASKPIAHARHAPVALRNSQDELSPAVLQGRSVAIVCGIGNPAGFRATLRELGATVVDQLLFPDHHPYHRDDVARIEGWARGLPAGVWLLTTQKDWVKLRIDHLGERPLRWLQIALEITHGRHALEAALLRLLAQPADPSSTDDTHFPAGPELGGGSSVRKDAYDPATTCPL